MKLTLTKSIRIRLIAAAVLAALGAGQAICAHYASYFPGDLEAARFIQSIHNPAFQAFMTGLSRLFTSWPAAALVTACVLVAWRSFSWLEGAAVAAAGISSEVIVDILKLLVGRPRPSGNLVHILLSAGGLSFPSGHTFFAVMLVGTVAFLAVRASGSRLARLLWVGTALALIGLAALSRVYLGAHWGSDVVGSFFFGGAALAVLTVAYDLAREYLARRESPSPP